MDSTLDPKAMVTGTIEIYLEGFIVVVQPV